MKIEFNEQRDLISIKYYPVVNISVLDYDYYERIEKTVVCKVKRGKYDGTEITNEVYIFNKIGKQFYDTRHNAILILEEGDEFE